jgi:MOSC domain-containing protein YiiM
MNHLQPGLMQAAFTPSLNPKAKPSPRAGIMSIVRTGGIVSPGDTIQITLPPQPHRPLICV